MVVSGVIGAQWGDEGKAKVTDVLAEQADYVVRYNGGGNAGHTLVLKDDTKIILHHIPSGILYNHTKNVIGNGMVVDILDLHNEMSELRTHYVDFTDRLFISDQAHMTFLWHRLLDILDSQERLGTTGRGIGQTYSDKINRKGIRFGVFAAEPENFREQFNCLYSEAVSAVQRRCSKEQLQDILENRLMDKKTGKHYGRFFSIDTWLNRERIFEEYSSILVELKQYICNTVYLLNKAIASEKNILLEGAQGTFLDIDHGTYPYVTSSNTTIGGACTGSGIAPRHIKDVYGVFKAYVTRVGEGPFPTELKVKDANGEKLRTIGHEYGATTGRPRRCGWFDAVLARYAIMINGITNHVVLTKLDILDEFEEIMICDGYNINGELVKEFPSDVSILAKAVPVYQKVAGWKTQINNCRTFEELPVAAKEYIRRVEEAIGQDISIISVGPKREETIKRQNVLLSSNHYY